MSTTWDATTDTQALKELAGLRGIAPSVRCLEKLPQQTNKTKVYHVRQNQQLYLWGVEMFQGGYDCVEIKKINSDGTETIEKNGGKYITDFIGNDKIVYNNQLTEYAPFDDFWIDPFLIDTLEDGVDKKIIKSNFFRSFTFPNEGFYKIILNERLNPLTGQTGFIADYTQPQYAPTPLIFSRYLKNIPSKTVSGSMLSSSNVVTLSAGQTLTDLHVDQNLTVTSSTSSITNSTTVKIVSFDVVNNRFTIDRSTTSTGAGDITFISTALNENTSKAPLQRVITDGEFRREIIIRVIGENKDIITNTSFTRVVKNLPTKSLLKDDLLDGSGKQITNVSITDQSHVAGPTHFKGNNAVIRSQMWDTNITFDYNYNQAPAGTRQISYDDISQKYFLFNLDTIFDANLTTFTNTSDLEYYPLNRHLYIGNKKRNNGDTIGSITNNGTNKNFSQSVEDPDSELKIINMRNMIIENVTFIGSDHGTTGGSFRSFSYRLNESTNQKITGRALIDISGSIIRNCTFIGIGTSFMYNNSYRNTNSAGSEFVTDGCVVENCKFINTGFLESMSCDGVLVKNCTWESPVRRGSPSVVSTYGGDSTCYMGNTFKCLGRSFFLDAGGPLINTCIIRCNTMLHGNHHTAGEILTIDQPQSGAVSGTGFSIPNDSKSWVVSGFMSLLNSCSSSAAGSYCMDSFYARCKLNLSAFNTTDKGNLFYLRGKNIATGLNSFTGLTDNTGRYEDSSIWCEYNVYMHNYIYRSTGQIQLAVNSNYNRILNCVFGNSEASPTGYDSYTTVGNSIYTFGYLVILQNNGEGSRTANECSPISNLINNCVLVDHADKFYKPKLSWEQINNFEYYGPRDTTFPPTSGQVTRNGMTINILEYRTDAGRSYDGEFPSNLTTQELLSRLNQQKNVMHNLTKISLRHM